MKRGSLRLWAILGILAAILVPASALAANSSVGVSVCYTLPQVVINSPADGSKTTKASVEVIGVADTGDNLSLLRNGNQVASLVVGASGDFDLSVPLVVGVNHLVAHVQSSCGATADSNSVSVTRKSVPVPPAPSSSSVSPAGSAPNSASTTSQSSPSSPPPTTNNSQPGAGASKPSSQLTLDVPGGSSTTSPTLKISGEAPAGSVVHITVNGSEVGWVTVGDDAHFSFLVELKIGVNIITAKVPGKNLETTIKVTRAAPKTTSPKKFWKPSTIAGVIAGTAIVTWALSYFFLVLPKA